MNVQVAIPKADLSAVKAKQHAAWSSGDYAVVGSTLQIVGEMLCEAVDLRSTHKVLDVAAGNGNATLAAARRFADVTSTDYVETLLERGRKRAEADGLKVKFQTADVEKLPFGDNSFDIVLSTYGVMFTADHEAAAKEMIRVCKPGGKIGMANWTPEGYIGRVFKTIAKYLPPASGVKSPSLWGTRPHLEHLFGEHCTVAFAARNFHFRYKSPDHWLETFRTYYGPLLKAFAALDDNGKKGLEADLRQVIKEINISGDETMVVPGEYLEVVVTKRR